MSLIFSWLFLLVAGLLEIVWAVGLKASLGFSRLLPSLITLAAMSGSFLLLALAMKSIPLSIAYPVWVSIGVIGTFLVGIIVYGEAANLARIISFVCLLAGIIGLKIFS